MAEIVQFKIFLRKNNIVREIRRCAIQSEFLNNFEYLQARIIKLFPVLQNKQIAIFWNDNEDNIRVSSDEELVFALSFMQGQVKKLFIEIIPKMKKSLVPLPVFLAPPVYVGVPPMYVVKKCDFPKGKKIPTSAESKQKKPVKKVELTVSKTEKMVISSIPKDSDNAEIMINNEETPVTPKMLASETEEPQMNSFVSTKDLMKLDGQNNASDDKNTENQEKEQLDVQDSIDLKNDLASADVTDNQSVNSGPNDSAEILSADKINEAQETILIDLETDSVSVKTISDTSESSEEKWTLLNLDFEHDTIEFDKASKMKNQTMADVAISMKDSIYLYKNFNFNFNLQEYADTEGSNEFNQTPNSERTAIFPQVATALRQLEDMGFNTRDRKFLLLAELYEGDISGILECLFY